MNQPEETYRQRNVYDRTPNLPVELYANSGENTQVSEVRTVDFRLTVEDTGLRRDRDDTPGAVCTGKEAVEELESLMALSADESLTVYYAPAIEVQRVAVFPAGQWPVLSLRLRQQG
jgi:hypothetical protein